MDVQNIRLILEDNLLLSSKFEDGNSLAPSGPTSAFRHLNHFCTCDQGDNAQECWTQNHCNMGTVQYGKDPNFPE